MDGAAFARRKPMVLLAYLAVEGPQPRARLARLFWPDASDPRNRLSVALHRIERDLPDVVHADAEVVAARIPTDVANVREALSRDDVERARELYGGTFLAGVVVPNVSPELEAWTVEVAEELADLLRDRLLRAGSRAGLQRRYPRAARHAEMAMQVSGARAPEPELLAQWHALALAGGSDVALRLRREADELGLAVAATPAEARAHLMAAVPRTNLPRETTTFVGRARERVELGRLLGDPGRPIVTILGPGGMGKTRLALGLARDQLATPTFAGGVFFVPLETVDRPEEIPNAVAGAIGADVGSGESATQAIVRTLGRRPALLLLDNVDHLVNGAGVIAELVRVCHGLFVLATSQIRLELEEESVFPLSGLTTPVEDATPGEADAAESVRLFVERARRSRLDFEPGDEDLIAIADLCRRLHGAPLPIELAAVWIRDRSPARIASELEASLAGLASPSRSIPERHRTLRASFEASWLRLRADERRALTSVSVFRGGFAPADAQAVCGVEPELIGRLRDRSLVSRGDREDPGPTRYDLHPMIAVFAREKLDRKKEAAHDLRRRHAAHYAALAARSRSDYYGPNQVAAMATFERERANLIQAASWSLRHDPDQALRLAGDRLEAWRYATRFAEGRQEAERALEGAASASAEARLSARVAAASMAYRTGDYRGARDHLEAAFADAALCGDPGADGRAWQVLGDVAHAELALDEAALCFAAAARSARVRNDATGEIAALTGAGRTAALQRRFEPAKAAFERSLALGRDRGAVASMATGEYNLGALARDLGDLDEARRRFEDALSHDAEIGDRWGIAECLNELAGIDYRKGAYGDAGRRYSEARGMYRAMGYAPGVAAAEHALGLVAEACSEPETAFVRQRTALRAYLDLQHEAHLPPVLGALARVAAVLGRSESAARLWGAERVLSQRLGRAPEDDDQDRREGELARLRARLGEATFERAYLEGSRREPSELVATTLSGVPDRSPRRP